MEYLFGVIAILAGLFVFERSKRKSAEAVSNNVEVKEKVQQEQGKMDKVDAKLELEEAIRAQLEADLKNQLNRKLNEDLAKFFNDRPNDK